MTPIGSLGFLAAGLPASIDAPLPVSDWEAGAAEEEEAPLEDPPPAHPLLLLACVECVEAVIPP